MQQYSCTIQATKKGSVPILVEKRPKGKVVSVISNVRGDPSELITVLKTKLGSGGFFKDGKIEVQGEHVEVITAVLLKLKGVVVGAKREKTPPPPPEPQEEPISRDVERKERGKQRHQLVDNLSAALEVIVFFFVLPR